MTTTISHTTGAILLTLIDRGRPLTLGEIYGELVNFTELTHGAINRALQSLCREGTVKRLRRGVYEVPEADAERIIRALDGDDFDEDAFAARNVVRVLQREGRPLSPAELSEATGYDQTGVRRALQALAEAGVTWCAYGLVPRPSGELDQLLLQEFG